MNEYLVFVRGRSEPIRLLAAKYFFSPGGDSEPNLVGFVNESDAVVARFPIADVQAIVDAKYHKKY